MPPPSQPQPKPLPVDPFQQVVALYHARRFSESRAAAARLLQRTPAHADALHLSALCLLAMGQAVQAEYFAQRAIALEPGRTDFAGTLAMTLAGQGKAQEAIAQFERVTAATPDDPAAWANLGRALLGTPRVKEAVAAFERAIAIDPGHASSIRELGLFWRMCGRSDRAVPLLKRAVRLVPGDAETAANLALALNYDEHAVPADILAAHVHAGRALVAAGGIAPAVAPAQPLRRAAVAGRPLRIGYLSPDLRSHSVALFLEPLLAGRTREKHAALLYMTMPKADEVSARLGGLADGWADVSGLTDTDLAARLRADKLDVLIDLAGLTRGSRVGIMARRVAPLQGTYLGYPSTTGVSGVDFRIVDSITDPPGSGAEAWHSERLVRLDRCFLAYAPPGAGETPDAVPARAPGEPATFGSFNLFMKISPGAARTWGRILARVPGSRLLLKTLGMESPSVRAIFTEMLAEAGLDASRVDFLPFATSRREHLATYGRVDVALDPFPYCGTATTCEALWMGVPVVTLSGRTHVQRVGESLLGAAGCADGVARSEDEYVERAVALATDQAGVGGLAVLRRGLRARLLASPLCDGAALARAFEGAVDGLIAS